MYHFSERSYRNLQGVRPELVAVMTLTLTRAEANNTPDFVVISGLRTEEEQRELLEQGKSQTMNSRHLTGHAIDIAAFDDGYEVTWERTPFVKIADEFKTAARDLGIAVEWGGDWKDFPDFGHFALDWEAYPA